MPALITHDTFGRELHERNPHVAGATSEERDAYLLGNQGPDPLFYSIASPSLWKFSNLGSVMHDRKPSELLVAFKQSIDILDPEDRAIGRAYARGFLAHYTLDCLVHPLVYCQQFAFCDAGIEGLTRRAGSEVHAVIESDIDEMVLFVKRGTTIRDFFPWREILCADEHVLDVISLMYAYVALAVYGTVVPRVLFSKSVHNFRHIQHLFHSPHSGKRAAFVRFERLLRDRSLYDAMSHRAVERTESVYANHEHAAWENPFTKATCTSSFWDLYDRAFTVTAERIRIFERPNFDLAAAQALTGELNFSGEPVNALLLSVENEE